MTQPRPEPGPRALYVASRRVLLDALEALRDHLDSVVLIGAQAVYVHVGAADLGREAHTSDSDLGIDPARLGDDPPINDAMTAAGFVRTRREGEAVNPGIWWTVTDVDGVPRHVEVDLMVPHALSRGGGRSAAIPPHDGYAVRRVRGIEVAIEEHSAHRLTALDPEDARSVEIEVAGITALLVAKA